MNSLMEKIEEDLVKNCWNDEFEAVRAVLAEAHPNGQGAKLLESPTSCADDAGQRKWALIRAHLMALTIMIETSPYENLVAIHKSGKLLQAAYLLLDDLAEKIQTDTAAG